MSVRKRDNELRRAQGFEDSDWFFDHFDKGSKSVAKFIGLAFFLNLLFWLIIIAAVVAGLVIVL